MESVKKAILKFYKIHPANVYMRFDVLQKMVNIKDKDLDTFLRTLLKDGFICDPQDGDNVIFMFRLNQ